MDPKAIYSYWQQANWRQIFNDFPLHPRDTKHLVACDKQTPALATQIGWLAPFVFENSTQNTLWIPLWLPVQVRNGAWQLRDHVEFPWIPSSQFDPLSSACIFNANLHQFDEWLRYECLQESGQYTAGDYLQFIEQALSALSQLSDDQWQQRLIERGFSARTDALFLPVAAALLPDLTPLQQQFARLDEATPQSLWVDEEWEARAQQHGDLKIMLDLSDEAFYAFCHAIEVPEQELLAIHTPIGSDKTDLIAALMIHLKRQGQSVWVSSSPTQRPSAAVDWIIIDEADRWTPLAALECLAFGKRALFFGQSQRLERVPLIGATQQDSDLKMAGLFDDESLELLQFKGMLVGSGNAFLVAQTNSAFQEDQFGYFMPTLSLKRQSEPATVQMGITNGEVVSDQQDLSNPKQAEQMLAFIQSQDLQGSILILTPFRAQKRVLDALVEAQSLDIVVQTPYELGEEWFDHVLFSTVYSGACRRPFVFDQGEGMLAAVFARARKTAWIIAEAGVFDPKMHSPSGNLAKKLIKS